MKISVLAMFKPSLFLLFLWFLLSPTAYSGPIDGSVSTGLRKMKINQLNQVGGHAGTNEGNVRRNDGVHGNLRCSDNDIITLNNCMDALYHGEISSSNLWVPSAKCYFSDKFDDIPGLGFQDISVGDVVPVWYNMVQQGLIPELVFSCWLNRNAKADEGGKLVSGEVDTNHFNDEQTYVAVTQKGYWSVIADSLTSMLVGPKGIVRRPPKRGPISSGGPGQTN